MYYFKLPQVLILKDLKSIVAQRIALFLHMYTRNKGAFE